MSADGRGAVDHSADRGAPSGSVKEDPMEQSTRDRASKAAALFLWAVVIIALGYGVVRTAIQAAALFTG